MNLHRLDLVSLSLFALIVRTGSISKGAELSHLAVGAASKRITDLEAAVGAELLERHYVASTSPLPVRRCMSMPSASCAMWTTWPPSSRTLWPASSAWRGCGPIHRQSFNSFRARSLLSRRQTRALGKRLRLRIQVRSFDAMCQMVAAGLGVAVLPDAAIQPHLRSMGLKKIDLASLPDVPPAAEAGLPELDATSWFAVFAPANTPKPVIDKLSSEIAKLMASPAFKQKAAEQGAAADYMTPQQLADYSKAELTRWAQVVKASKIEAD
jgi:DNA-binding transcriptional LysR family regulator